MSSIKAYIRTYYASRPDPAQLLDECTTALNQYAALEKKMDVERAALIERNRRIAEEQEKYGALGEWQTATSGSSRAAIKRIYEQDDVESVQRSALDLANSSGSEETEEEQLKNRPFYKKRGQIRFKASSDAARIKAGFDADRVRIAQFKKAKNQQ